MLSTMGEDQLTVTSILCHGEIVHSRSHFATYDGSGVARRSYAEIAARSERLAAALQSLGVGRGDRVATLCWNHVQHMEAYLAVPCMGSVLLTLNLRLAAGQLRQIAGHAAPRALIVDESLLETAATFLESTPSIEAVIVCGEGSSPAALPERGLRYEELIAGAESGFEWPDLEEREAAVMCYTTGTTGDPKGVVYGHRSIYLHSLALCTGNVIGLSERDGILLIVPMFHANAWGLPYAGWLMGSDFIAPREFLQGTHLAALIERERPTVIAGVPTIFTDLHRVALSEQRDLSSVRLAVCGGSAVSRSLIEEWHDDLAVTVLQAWGMTETSPLAAAAHPPKDAPAEQESYWRSKAGRVAHGVQLRIVDADGRPVPHDGVSVGEIEVRGPWVTAGYYRNPAPQSFDDGWLRTGDIGTIDDHAYIQITDRAKDVIKSGGEWISSVELESLLAAHPDLLEAAVIAVPDDRWQERPAACIVPKPGTTPSFTELRAYLAPHVAKWWLPERWALLSEIPKTSVGKFDKKALRELYAQGKLATEHVDSPPVARDPNRSPGRQPF